MSQPDLYSLLREYAEKAKTSYINVDIFLDSVKKYAVQKHSDNYEWEKWIYNGRSLFEAEMPALLENGSCLLQVDNKGECVFMYSLCREQITEAYKDMYKLVKVPFPDEVSLRLKIPHKFARLINLTRDMGVFFGEHEDAPDPQDIIVLQFPHGCGSAVLFSSVIPRRLIEISLLRVQFYMRNYCRKEYLLSKLSVQMKANDGILKSIVERITEHPLDSLSEMERSPDFPYLFWTCFCSTVKSEYRETESLRSEDIAILQAIFIIEVCCGYYHTIAAKKREIEAAFSTLESIMDRSPWLYSLDEITGFKNDRGIHLLDIYSKKDLEEYINKATGSINDGVLPSWLTISQAKQNNGAAAETRSSSLLLHRKKEDRLFAKKEKYLHICTKMISDMQPSVKNAIVKRWTKLIREYTKEEAMKSDAEFEKYLQKLINEVNPIIMTMLKDSKLYLAYMEIESAQNPVPQSLRIFRDGVLIPYSTLFKLRRKDIIHDIKLMLPFWHSVPVIVSIAAFFYRLKKKKKRNLPKESVTAAIHAPQVSNELLKSAQQVKTDIMPSGKTIDKYISELEDKSIQILDVRVRQNFIIDLQSLLQDNIRNALKLYKLKTITRESLRDMSALLIRTNPALTKNTDQKSLRLYMEVYMLKLLLEN
ncbi:MAG: hypothetical protein FWG89_05725 [Treponema sp.]|nr:hypothetical protein [Treponema sp.]